MSQYFYYVEPYRSAHLGRQKPLLDAALQESILQSPWTFRMMPHLELGLHSSSPSHLRPQIESMDLLVMERFDESLVLRHFLWGWPLEDFLYIKTNSCNGPRWDGRLVMCAPSAKTEPNFAKKIEEKSVYDLFVYREAVRAHESAIALIPEELWIAALQKFTIMNAQVQKICKDARPMTVSQLRESFQMIKRNGVPNVEQIQKNKNVYCAFFLMGDEDIENSVRAIPAMLFERLSKEVTNL